MASSSLWTFRKRRSSLPLSAFSSSRRRRRRLDNSSLSSWASLPGDLLPLIGWRLLTGDGGLLDYVLFRAVCAHWRSSTVCPRGRSVVDPRFHPRRWMMLPEGHGLYPGHRKLHGYIRFFNTSTVPATLVRSNLHPLFKDHVILHTIDGLLLLRREEDTAIHLLHPFTGDIAEFPPLRTVVQPDENTIQLKIGHTRFGDVSAASLSVSTADGVLTLMLVFFGIIKRVAFASPRDQKGSVSSWRFSRMCIHQPLPFQGKIYTFSNPMPHPRVDSSETLIFRIDPPDDQSNDVPPLKLITKFPSGKVITPFKLAECNSEILLICFRDPSLSGILVYRLADLILRKVVPVTSIVPVDNVILISQTTLSVRSRLLPNIEGNSILAFNYNDSYFGQYHLGSGTWSPMVEPDGSTYGSVTGPRTLVCHIFTCCRNSSWRRGAISFRFKSKDVREMRRKQRSTRDINYSCTMEVVRALVVGS